MGFLFIHLMLAVWCAYIAKRCYDVDEITLGALNTFFAVFNVAVVLVQLYL